MRRLVDVAAVIAAIGMIGSMSWAVSSRMEMRRKVQGVAAETERFQKMIAFRAASKTSGLNARGWPETIDPAWFTEQPPRNDLVSPERPWVEIATADEADLRDPLIRMTINPLLASFWYNPHQGVVRARVPVTISDSQSLEWYNRINGTNLDSIYTHDTLTGPPATKPADKSDEKAATSAAAEEPAKP